MFDLNPTRFRFHSPEKGRTLTDAFVIRIFCTKNSMCCLRRRYELWATLWAATTPTNANDELCKRQNACWQMVRIYAHRQEIASDCPRQKWLCMTFFHFNSVVCVCDRTDSCVWFSLEDTAFRILTRFVSHSFFVHLRVVFIAHGR